MELSKEKVLGKEVGGSKEGGEHSIPVGKEKQEDNISGDNDSGKSGEEKLMSAMSQPLTSSYSVFNPMIHGSEVTSKIIVLIDKISHAMRAALWERSKRYDLTATQGQILLYLLFNPEEKRNISCMADEFGVSKPTISRAVDSLVEKGFIDKKINEKNRRSHILTLTSRGIDTAMFISSYANHLRDIIGTLSKEEKEKIASSLLTLVQKFVENKALGEFPSCLFCKYFEKSEKGMWCSKLELILTYDTIKVECPYFESRTPKEKKRRRRRKMGGEITSPAE